MIEFIWRDSLQFLNALRPSLNKLPSAMSSIPDMNEKSRICGSPIDRDVSVPR